MQTGFTLLEMSIVVVVIAFLAAGIVSSKSLISNAKARKQISQLTSYIQAANAFQLKYQYLPGDIPTNKRLGLGFPVVAGLEDCHHGDGFIDTICADPDPTTNRLWLWPKPASFFPDLSTAGMADSNYILQDWGNPGTFGPGGEFPTSVMHEDTGIVPFSANQDLGFFIGINLVQSLNNGWFWQHITQNDGVHYDGAFTPQEAHAIDAKMDDGMPGSGNVWSVLSINWYQWTDHMTHDTLPNYCMADAQGLNYNLTMSQASGSPQRYCFLYISMQ